MSEVQDAIAYKRFEEALFWYRAVTEAGRAVMQALVGHEVSDVTLIREDSEDNLLNIFWRRRDPANEDFIRKPGLAEDDVAMVLAASSAANALEDGRSLLEFLDWLRRDMNPNSIGCDEGTDIGDLFRLSLEDIDVEECAAEAFRLLDENWADVERVASALVGRWSAGCRHVSLSGAEVRDVLGVEVP